MSLLNTFLAGGGVFEADIFGGDKATYLGMGIGEVSDSDCECVILDPVN